MDFKVATNCPLCDMTWNHYHAIVPGKGLHYRACECGLYHHLWAMTEETLAEYYKNDYRSKKGSPEVTDFNVEEENVRADKIVRFIGAEINPRNALDIGCSTGMLMKRLQDLHRCKVTGVEPGDNFREYCRSLGLNVLSNIDCLNGNPKYDLITMIHVLEHLVEPMPFLEKVRGLMTEGGKLIVEVPVLMYTMDHPLMFTEETLRLMLDKAGFEIRKLEMGVFSLSDNISMIAEAYLDT